MGSDSDGGDYESPATLLAVAIAHSPNIRHTLFVLVEGEDSRCLGYIYTLLMLKIDLSEGEDNPSCLKRKHLQSFFCVCSEML